MTHQLMECAEMHCGGFYNIPSMGTPSSLGTPSTDLSVTSELEKDKTPKLCILRLESEDPITAGDKAL